MEYNKSRIDMPKKRVIFSHWKDTLLKKHNRDIKNKYTCFACLRDGFVERCHIEPLVPGQRIGTKGRETLMTYIYISGPENK